MKKDMSNSALDDLKSVLLLLESQRRALKLARASPQLLEVYSAVMKYLRRLPPEALQQMMSRTGESPKTKSVHDIPVSELQSLTVEDVERLVADEASTRKLLEMIAIERFKVPRGSMRSFQNMQSLK